MISVCDRCKRNCKRDAPVCNDFYSVDDGGKDKIAERQKEIEAQKEMRRLITEQLGKMKLEKETDKVVEEDPVGDGAES